MWSFKKTAPGLPSCKQKEGENFRQNRISANNVGRIYVGARHGDGTDEKEKLRSNKTPLEKHAGTLSTKNKREKADGCGWPGFLGGVSAGVAGEREVSAP